MRVLGIETSCDETAAAVVSGEGEILSNVIRSQIDEHSPYGGVVPEIAARAHVEVLDGLIEQAMAEAGTGFADLDGVAVTSGPGLIGGVMVGLMTAKAIASVHQKPLIAVNHLEAHALSARLTDGVAFPYLLLLVSGGHCQLLIVRGVGDFTRLGTTIDDAVGEAFDKTAKLLGLGYPGGPAVEAAAVDGDPDRFDLPRPLLNRDDCHFSLSGLKTAVRREAEKLEPMTDKDRADLCASFQAAIGDVLAAKTGRAMETFVSEEKVAGAAMLGEGGAHRQQGPVGDLGTKTALSPRPVLVTAGGVAANQFLRNRLSNLCADKGFNLVCPPPALCTDNAAMIAWAGVERLRLGLVDDVSAPARARWPLDPGAPPVGGAGVKA